MEQISTLYQIYKRHPTVCTDTRKIQKDVLFFALKGENFDANTFAKEALEKGAEFVVIDDEKYYIDHRTILVNNSLTTLQELAKYHRKQWEIPVIGLTGTNGKTTTKELIYSVLSQKYQSYATTGNLNNHIGVPLTILGKPENCEIAIIEMGANHPFEIEFLCQIAQPTHGLITNVGKAHLEGFGGFEGVIKTKGELYEWLRQINGTVFIQSNNTYLQEMRRQVLNEQQEIISYGTKQEALISGEITQTEPYLSIQWDNGNQQFQINTQLTGMYNFENILAAICIGHYFNLTPTQINSGIEKYTPTNNRSQLIKKQNNTLICDFYNANPSSMQVALENLASFKSNKKITFLGDMFELGDDSFKEHLNVIEKAKNEAIDEVIFIGQNFYTFKTQFPSYAFFETTEQAFSYLKSKPLAQNATILIKGSRGMKMEQLIEIFD